MTLLIRPGRQKDVPDCVDILRAWVDETPWVVEPRNPQEMIADWRGYFRFDLAWVAEIDERIVGFCSRGDDNINALYVVSDVRSKGVGKALLDQAKADRDWITVWAYEKNRRAREFYRREGLIEVGQEVEAGSGLVDIEHRWTRSA